MKRILRENDRGHAICRSCKRRVAVVYRYRGVPLESPEVSVPNVLVGVCEECRRIATIPWQSNQRLQTARKLETERLARAARIEARIPSELYEALKLIAAQLEARDEAFSHLMLRFYLGELRKDKRFASRVLRLSSSKKWGPASRRLSLRLSPHLQEEALRAARKHGLSDQSALIKGLISAAWEDVFKGKSTRRREFLEGLAEATG